MANHGGVGAKFVSVNLNKSYGPVSNRNNNNSTNSSYGQAATGRGRGDSGMVVLSRPKSSSQKPGPKLSVPPPLNLPSLRKEHERFDLSGPGGGSAGRAGPSGTTRPASSGVGWSKPATGALQELNNDSGSVDGLIKSGSASMPPSLPARLDKAAVLRGEDFPSLKAALPSGTASGPAQKNKDMPHHQKQKSLLTDELANETKYCPSSSPEVLLTPHRTNGNESNEKVGDRYELGNLPMTGQARKLDVFFPGPLPLVRLNPRLDWADDERDTGQGFVDRSKDYGYSNSEAYWDRDFDMPMNRVLLHKLADNQFQSEVRKRDSFVKTPSREGNSWRATPLPKDEYDIVGGRTMNLYRGIGRDVKSVPPREEYSQSNATLNQDFNFGRRGGFGPGNQRYNTVDTSHSRVNDRYSRDFYGTEQSNRHRGYSLQNSSGSKSFSPSGKWSSVNDTVPSAFLNDERTKPVDAFLGPASFDEQDPFSSGLVGMIKRKKDVAKQDDFHDPVRESFEAELERVQKMQEQERQRIADEQKRVLEQAQREEEERHRLIMEEEEQLRRAEEAAREAAWRAEQEHLEAIRRAEELRIAREEEKKNMMMEEERRKQAAKQKLLELEARMAKRNVETVHDNSSVATSDDRRTTAVMDRDISRVADFESWEDSERMVERLMTSGSSDSSGLNGPLVPGRAQSSRDVGSGFVDRVKPANPWRSGMLKRDGSVGGGAFPKNDFHGVLGYMPSRNNYSGGSSEIHAENDPYSRSMDTQFHGNVSGDGGWGQGNSRSNTHYPYADRLSTDGDELYPHGRSRYSMRQPRVLPPPSIVPMQRTFFREENEQVPYSSAPRERVEALEIADVAQQNTVAQEQMEDSQSSLSVSSPPRSPAHLSHDYSNESVDSPTVSATERLVAGKLSSEDTVVAGTGMISDTDGDWSAEDNKELQEQEEYDEDEDDYQVEEDVREGDDDLNQEFDDLHTAEKGSLDMMENLVLGFDEGVEVRLPRDDFETSSRNEEGAITDQEKTVDRKQEADMAMADSVMHHTETDRHTSPASDLLNTVDRSSVNIASHSSSSQTVVSTVPVGSSPINAPIKLQFGLFSGPPLIPSPIPAIQFGSIQVPLHIHPLMNPPLTHVNQSQAPIFQFGKLRYATPISQGIVPITPQMSFVSPNVQTGYNLNQSSVDQQPIQPKQEGLANTIIVEKISSSSRGGGNNAEQKKVDEAALSNENKFMPEAGSINQLFSGVENHSQLNESVLKGMHASEDSRGLRAQGQQSGYKSKRYAYVARNSNMRSAIPAPEASRSNSGGFQRRPRRTVIRTEFRVRENMDHRQSFPGRNAGVFVRSESKKELIANKSAEQMVELEPSSSVQQPNTDFRVDNNIENNSQSVEMNLKSDEDVDAPLQSGIVHVFKQPGIEAPSDEDDFIQVRSKRQVLNDRREQREKEIKAKSQAVKASRKVGPVVSNDVLSRSSSTKCPIIGKEVAKNTRSDIASKSRGLTNMEASDGFASVVSHPLAPIGTPTVTSDVQADKKPLIIKSLQTGASSAISYSKKDVGSGLVFETKNKILDDVQRSDSWVNSHINEQVMTLTQTQLDEAMRTGRFDTHSSSTSGNSSSVMNPIVPSSSVVTKNKSFSSTASPVNSLLAGEKIEFGAVTSPTVLAPSTRAVSHGIRAPGSSRSGIQTSHSLSTSDKDCTLLYEKKKHQSEPCVHLEDSEAEAQAEVAASAVVIATISSDESVSVSDTKSFQGGTNGLTRGIRNEPQLSSQSRAEESLSVSLPADLSVETPPMSMWPPLQSPQSSSGEMPPHIPGGPSSPFPFYEMGPMLGRPIFAFGPHDESGGTQSQPQKGSVTGSTPNGAWQQFHTGSESFYGPPSGFPGPYMPHGGIPGVQGPPHMVVYNHFPVGQFGQVGLSFMGTTTYIPSEKQTEWKHNNASSNREGDSTNMNMGSGPSNPHGMASVVQHLAPSPQVMHMPPPLTLFDMSPFQSAPDMSAQGQWPRVSSSPLHSTSLPMPPQQPDTHALNRFSEPRTSTPDSTQFPLELGLVNSSSSNQSSAITNSATPASAQSGGNNNNTYKTRASQRNLLSQHQYNHHSTGYGYQRNRMGYNHARNNLMGVDKSFPSKMKQIYVAKQTNNSGSTAG